MSDATITPPTMKQYLVAALTLVDAMALLIEAGESAATIKAWLLGMDAQDDRSPLLVLLEDRAEFMTRARQFAVE